MKYLGIYQSFQPILCKRPQLFAYAENVNIIINYDELQPFLVEHIGILLDMCSDGNKQIEAYDVFECGIHFTTDNEAKAFAVSLAQNLIKYRYEFSRYYNNKHLQS